MFNIRHHQLKSHAPGIYFNEPEILYHQDPALSRGDIVRLLVHYYDYWEQSAYNPEREKTFPTASMKKGSNKHLYLLQPELFKRTFRSAMEAFDKIRATLSRKEYDEIVESIELLAPIYEIYFSRGYPEVSIYWQDEETGINHRARIDYLQTCGGVDYKTVQNLELNALGWVINKNGYDIQAMLYSRGILAAKALLKAGKFHVQGEVAPEWLKMFENDPDTFFEFVFQRSTKAYVFEPIRFNMGILENADGAIRTAQAIFVRAMEEFGAKKKWPAGRKEVTELTEYHMPRRIFDRGMRESA